MSRRYPLIIELHHSQDLRALRIAHKLSRTEESHPRPQARHTEVVAKSLQGFKRNAGCRAASPVRQRRDWRSDWCSHFRSAGQCKNVFTGMQHRKTTAFCCCRRSLICGRSWHDKLQVHSSDGSLLRHRYFKSCPIQVCVTPCTIGTRC